MNKIYYYVCYYLSKLLLWNLDWIVLEKPNINLDIDDNNELVILFRKYYDKYLREKKEINISLSGGVDSMVVLKILLHLRNKFNFKINAIYLDYNQRIESNLETQFLIKYCEFHKVNLTYQIIENLKRKDGITKRQVFEEGSRDLRYQLYHQVIKSSNNNNILLGHHLDDIIENIFTNFIRNRNYFDLKVMKENTIKENITFGRPFISIFKDKIYQFAHQYQVPYFKDTTPKWSNRGKMRNEIFPLLVSVFGEQFKNNLLKMGETSDMANQLLNDTLDNYPITYYPLGAKFNITKNKLILKNLVMKIMHHFNKNNISDKTFNNLFQFVNSNKTNFLNLKDDYYLFIQNNQIYIIKWIYQSFLQNNYHIEKINTPLTKNFLTIDDLLCANINYTIQGTPIYHQIPKNIKLPKSINLHINGFTSINDSNQLYLIKFIL